MTLASQAYIRWLFEQETARQDNIAVFRDYYDGDQQSYLTTRAEEYLEHHGRELSFCLNVCPVVVDTPADRMAVSGFRVAMPPSLQPGEDNAGATDEEQSPEDEWGELLNEWWTDNRCDGMQRMVYKSAFRDGESYVIVDWDEEHMRPRFNFQPAFTSYGGNSNNGQGVKVHYADGGKVYCASKRWREDTFDDDGKVTTIQRMNMYFDDRMEMWYSSNENEAMWQRWTEDGGDGVIEWVDSDGRPLGVPVYHFKNCEVGYTHGISELKSVIPLQNAINKLLIDMMQQADYEAFGVFWQTGGERPDGYIFPGSMLWNADADVKYGRIDPAGQGHYLENVDSTVKWVASITRTPQYMFYQTGQMPSGEALKTSESGLVAKVKDREVGFGNAWEDAMHMAIKLQNAFGEGIDIPDGALITCLWDEPATMTMEEEIRRAEFLVGNGYESEALRLMGYDDTEIERMKREKEDDQLSQANVGVAFATEARRRMEQAPVPPGAPAVARKLSEQE